MSYVQRVHIRSYEIGLRIQDGELISVLEPGRHTIVDWRGQAKVDVYDRRAGVFGHWLLDVFEASGKLAEYAEFYNLSDTQRALVWCDGVFSRVIGPGRFGCWKSVGKTRVEIRDTSEGLFEHKQRDVILQADTDENFVPLQVLNNHSGVLMVDGEVAAVLSPGRYAYWRDARLVNLQNVSLQETTADMPCQEIMTRDKVTLRLNTLLSYRVADAVKAATYSADAKQSLYRVGQLALRELVGHRTLDELLEERNSLAELWKQAIENEAAELGLKLLAVGIRDIILPGEMKQLLNKVTEAKKNAEANLITRREETAAMRSQANSAKLLESNPVLMKLKELEMLQAIASESNLQVVLGDSTLGERLTKLI